MDHTPPRLRSWLTSDLPISYGTVVRSLGARYTRRRSDFIAPTAVPMPAPIPPNSAATPAAAVPLLGPTQNPSHGGSAATAIAPTRAPATRPMSAPFFSETYGGRSSSRRTP